MRIGVDLGGTKIEAAVLAADGRIVLRQRVRTPQGNYAETIEAVAKLVEACEASSGAAATVGIGIPGAISPANGLVKNANSTWLIGRPLADDLARRIGRPVRLANDANCFALSEATDGAGAGADCVFGVILGTGVGAGVVVHGRVLEGPNGIAGEWGHNPLPWADDDERPGPDCYCGKRGCIETYLSGPGLANDHARIAGANIPPEQIVDNATNGDPQALETLSQYDRRLARALAHVINVLDPDVIVLGGGLSNLDRLFARVPTLWRDWVFSDRVDTRLVRHAHGDSSGVRGAAWLGRR